MLTLSVSGPSPDVLVEAFVSSSHRIVQLVAPGHHPPAGLGALLPVVHVVLFEGACGAETPQTGQAEGFLHRHRGRLVDVDPGPDFYLVRVLWVPDPEGVGRGAEEGEVREQRADDGVDQATTGSETPRNLRADLFLIGQDFGYRGLG